MRGRPFEPGNRAGKGRPKGSRNKLNQLLQEILDQNSEIILRKCIILAMQGQSVPLRLLFERIMPARRDCPVQIDLPPTKSMADVDTAYQTVLQAISSGQLTPGEGETLSKILESRRRMIELTDLESRIASAEAKINAQERSAQQ